MSNNPFQTITAHDPPSFTLSMTDDAEVQFGVPLPPGAPPVPPGDVSFLDTGYMPINQLTIGGALQNLHGRFDGLYIQYTGTGVQAFLPGSNMQIPTAATYDTLSYQLFGYKGDAVFGHAADGTPTVSGATHQTVLAQGSLIAGGLAFTPTGGIAGLIDATYEVGGTNEGTLLLSVQHSAADIGHTARGGLTLSGGELQATFYPAA